MFEFYVWCGLFYAYGRWMWWDGTPIYHGPHHFALDWWLWPIRLPFSIEWWVRRKLAGADGWFHLIGGNDEQA